MVREAFPTRGDKAVRAQSIRGRMAMHGLYVQSGAPVSYNQLTLPTGDLVENSEGGGYLKKKKKDN